MSNFKNNGQWTSDQLKKSAQVAPEDSKNRKSYLKEFEKGCEESVEVMKNGQWNIKKNAMGAQPMDAASDVNCAKKEHDDKKEDEKLIDEKIKEHEKDKHSKEGHKKEHKEMGLDKEEMKKNPVAAAAIGAAATGFGSKMADRVSDKVGL